MDVVFHCGDRDEQRVGDLRVGEPGRDQGGNLELPFRENIETPVRSRGDVNNRFLTLTIDRDAHLLVGKIQHLCHRQFARAFPQGGQELPDA